MHPSLAALVTITVVASSVRAADASHRLAVAFEAADPERAWLASALEKRVEAELSRFGRVTLLPKEPAAGASCADDPCRVRAHAARGAEVVVLGRLVDERLSYGTYLARTTSRIDSGSIYTGASLGRIDGDIGAAVRPIVGSDGLLERLGGDLPAPATANAGPARVPWLIVLVALLVLLVSPLVAARRMLPAAALRAALRPRSLRYSALSIAGLSAALLLASLPAELLPLELPELRLGWLTGAAPLLGGVAWAWLTLLLLRLVLPTLHGLERVGFEALPPLLRAFTVVTLVRLALLAPLGGLAWLGHEALCRAGFDPALTAMLLLPLAGLLGYFWLLSLVDHLTVVLDHHYVQGVVGPKNPRHAVIERYLRSYAARARLDPSDLGLADVLLLPGQGEAAVTYGGGFARTRIVLPVSLLETALGPLPAEAERQERGVDLDELAAGVLVPALDERAAKRRSAVAPARRPAAARGLAPRLLGEQATALGYVLPRPHEEAAPLVSNNREDFGAVRELLTEHYAAFEKREGDDDFAGAEITHKDFLFGVLLRELGVARRRDDLWHTLGLALGWWSGGATALTKKLLRHVVNAHGRFWSRYPATLADAYAAANGGLHHLVQYLHFLRTWREADLTARADMPRLLAASLRILRATGKESPAGADVHRYRATLRNRLVWLSRLSPLPLEEPRARWATALAISTVVLAAAGLLGHLGRQAVDYHPIYTARLAEQQARLEADKEESTDDRAHQE